MSARNLCHAPLSGKRFEPIRVTRESLASQLVQLLYAFASFRIVRCVPWSDQFTSGLRDGIHGKPRAHGYARGCMPWTKPASRLSAPDEREGLGPTGRPYFRQV
jgi:hypothetical protein